MVLAGIFAMLGLVMIGFLYLCWLRYWRWVRYWHTVPIDQIPDARSVEGLRLRQIQEEECMDREDSWHGSYHWCLLLGPVFFGAAVYCVLDALLGDCLWMVRFFPAFFGGMAVSILGWRLGYGPVREYVLPLEGVVLGKK